VQAFTRRTCLAGIAILVAAAAAGFASSSLHSKRTRHDVATAMTGGDADLAPPILRKYGCTGCHTIPGIPGADGKVGGSLNAIKQRVYIAGVLNNTSDNLTRWIVTPPAFSPRTAMPVTGINEEQARHVAAYLYAH